ncbi:glutaredoxin domain-containing protein [Nocardioides salsibiostraticola]
MIARWAASVAMVLAAAAVIGADPGVSAVFFGGALLVFAFGLSPLPFPRSPGDRAGQEAAQRGVPAIYWRPGCSFCLRLRVSLGLSGRGAVWVDISRDADAAARVRSVNAGNETVPTVFLGEETRTNPDPSWVRSRLPV